MGRSSGNQAMSTMTLNLSEKEMAVLESLCDAKDVSKTQLMRQALRLYQLVDVKLSRGMRMKFCNAAGEIEIEPLMMMDCT
jgi:Ribbon-helix-helix protein, copG family